MKHQIESLADQIYGRLREEIIHGRLQPGKRLVELDIAAQMGTSQGPVREALQRLERDGLVERRVRSATFVADISIGEIYELFSIRSLVENMRLASRADDMILLVEHDLEFHRRICEWSGSATLFRTWMPLYSQIQRFIALMHRRYFPDLVELANTHQPRVEVLRGREAEEAARIIRSKVEPQAILVKD
jgi:DNA-binding GntR family transcriptional regulator